MFWKRPTQQPKGSPRSASQEMLKTPAAEHSLNTDLHADLGEALRWLERGVRDEIRAFAFFHDLTKALYKAGLTSEAATVAVKARKLIVSMQKGPSQETRAEAFGHVLRALAITEPSEEVLRVLAEFPRVTGLPLTNTDRSGILFALSDSVLEDTDDVPKAFAFISGITDDERRDCAYGSVCQALARQLRVGETLELSTRIGNVAPHHWRSFFLQECVEIICKLGAVDDALGVAKQIPEDSSRSTGLFSVAQALANLGRASEASAVLEQALATPRDDRRSSQEFAFLTAATIQATLGNMEEALSTANKIERQRPRYSWAIGNICRIIASKGELPQALTVASKADNRDVAALGIVEGLITAGLLKEAEDVLNRIRNDEQRWDGWKALALGLAKEAKVVEVLRIADRFPRKMSWKGDRAVESLAVALAKQGKYPQARGIITQRWRSDPISRVEALAGLCSASQATSQK